jgi:nucleoside-diphosphate-sugar epimerase
MKIFVTGAAGFLGRAITRELLNNKHKVTALLLPDDEIGLDGEVVVKNGDITDPDSIKGMFGGHDAVVHCAGAVDFLNRSTCIAVNREGTRNVVAEAVHSKIRRFVHISSVSVYGRLSSGLVDEKTPRRKIGSPYGDTKIDAELIVEEFQKLGMLDATIFRPSIVFGEGDNRFLPPIIARVENGSYTMVGDGSNRINLVCIGDLAKIVATSLREEKSIGQIYNVSNPDSPTWKELLDTIASEVGCSRVERYISHRRALLFSIVNEFVSLFTGRLPKASRSTVKFAKRNCQYNITKVKEGLGFSPDMGALDGVVQWMRAR